MFLIMFLILESESAQEVTCDDTVYYSEKKCGVWALAIAQEMGNLTFHCTLARIVPVTNFSFFYINLLL